MPGILYIVSVMSAGLLSVLLLALRTEQVRSKAVDDALAKLPGIRPDRRLSAGRRGLAVDDQNRALCVICAETQTVRLYVVPFTELNASELRVNGKSVSRVERGSPFESVSRNVQAPEGEAEFRLRIEVRDACAPVHELALADLRVAKFWQSQLRAMIAATEPLPQSTTCARQEPAGERRAAVQPGPARKPQTEAEAPRAERAAGSGAAEEPVQHAPQPAARKVQTTQDITSPQLRTALRKYLSGELKNTQRITVSERKLRDACAPHLPLVRFHEQMNRLRRAKALVDFRLTYSRKTETWRISRADERRAAA